eukprot:ANDGO_00266.mRNA.1 Eukaryotic peptide chain release factor GTP-binding subunit
MSSRFKFNLAAAEYPVPGANPGAASAPAPAPAPTSVSAAAPEPVDATDRLAESMEQTAVSSSESPVSPGPPTAVSPTETAAPVPTRSCTLTSTSDAAPSPKTKQPTTSHLDLAGGEDEIEADEPSTPVKQAPKITPGKRTMNIVFIGHVDAGKSTTSGHIMYLMGNVDERTLERYEREAKARNRESWKYAWVIDTNEEERDRGKTVEVGHAHFETEKTHYTILDAPGHKAFVPHMIGGASQADVAVLVISARAGEFEAGFDRGGQTREHVMLAKTAGVRHLIIAINKMDDPTVMWSKERYDSCVEKLVPFVRSIGFNPKDINILPIAGLAGLNLKDRLPAGVFPSYDGPSLIEVLENLKAPERLVNAPVRFVVTEKYKEMGGSMVLGKLETGVITVGKKLMVNPTGAPCEVFGIFIDTNEILQAEPGDNVRLGLKGVDVDDLHAGYVLTSPEYVMPAVTKFEAQLMLLDCKNIISAGYTCMLHIHSAVSECTLSTLVMTLDKKTKEPLVKKPKFLKTGDTAIVRIEVPQSICMESFQTLDKLGRFMLRDEGKTIGIGVVTKLPKSVVGGGASQAE